MKKTAWLGLVLSVLLSACSDAGGYDGRAGTASDTSAGGAEANSVGQASTPPRAEDNAPSIQLVPNERVKLVVATYYLSEQVKEAVKKYEKLHPNIEIELHASSTSGENLNDVLNKREQFVKTNNAALLAGSGPDVIELDELPSDQYAKRQLLVDLNKLMKQDPNFHREQYFDNVLDHSQDSGKLYGMPLYFSLVGLFGDADAIEKAGVTFDDSKWTLNDFIDIAKQLKQKGSYKYSYSEWPSNLLVNMVSENYAQLVSGTNGNAYFDTDALADMMRKVTTLGDEELIYKSVESGITNKLDSRAVDSSDVDAYFSQMEVYSLRDAVVRSPYKHTKLYIKPHPANAGDGGYFKPFGTLGINGNSAHPEVAWDFIKFLLNDESVQSYVGEFDDNPGFPLNRSVYEHQADKIKSDGLKDYDDSTVKVDPAFLEQMGSYLSKAVNAVRGPSKIEGIVDKQSEAFFSGQKSAEAAAKLIGNKIDLLLNE
ncbi:Putative ABC transporter substrate-binding protein YesO [Paenibacillus konkukensis]|uniref:ABC transporter substrate-binding protein YesO n=1 Tax=Paenibacillus konkukensis TaxID=2020716 RepID=A0ABY4RJM5_9BACL|nr:extracellular solute-binding protein [Paenibacillus konkukensis]UQZ82412.1 Putative ABC transporter substrate-binding protein YesO [Paenibacillus konkukensis]